MNTDYCDASIDDYWRGFDLLRHGTDTDWQTGQITFEGQYIEDGAPAFFSFATRLVFIDQPGETAVCHDSASPVRFHELPSGTYTANVVATVTISP